MKNRGQWMIGIKRNLRAYKMTLTADEIDQVLNNPIENKWMYDDEALIEWCENWSEGLRL